LPAPYIRADAIEPGELCGEIEINSLEKFDHYQSHQYARSVTYIQARIVKEQYTLHFAFVIRDTL